MSVIIFLTLLTKVFVARLRMSRILFSTVVNVAFVAKLLILGTLFSISEILVL